MTQELIDLRNSILQGRYTDALALVDELEGMSKQAILGNIQSYLKILIIYLIKNQIEQQLTNSWSASIRNSISAKELPTVVAEALTKLPGGEDWKTGKR